MLNYEALARAYKYDDKTYDELSQESQEAVIAFWKKWVSCVQRLFTITRPYKCKHPYGTYIDTDSVSAYQYKPPTNQREEHDNFISNLVKEQLNRTYGAKE